jgi:DNA-binding PadR family transcriptional regulator
MSLKHSILALLSRESKTGYDLSRDAENSTRFFWSATHQQVYKDLSRLEEEGLVHHQAIEQNEKPDKKAYSITKTGMKELKHWMRQPSEPKPSKDEFLIKLFVGDLVSSEILLEDLLRQKDLHLSKRERYLEIERKYFKDRKTLSTPQRFRHLTLRRGILSETAWLSWCDEVESFLRQQQNLA